MFTRHRLAGAIVALGLALWAYARARRGWLTVLLAFVARLRTPAGTAGTAA